MLWKALGPLERAISTAVVLAEDAGFVMPFPSLLRAVPGYETRLPNVRAALEEGEPLRHWVSWERGLCAPVDRPDATARAASAQGHADDVAPVLRQALRGLGKLPWVEAVAVRGPLAWGQWDGRTPIPLLLIAEGGRPAQARRAAGWWLRTVGRSLPPLQVEAVLDGDDLSLPPGDAAAGLAHVGLAPVTHTAAWSALWTANPWLQKLFPNHDPMDPVGRLDLGAGGAIDGRLARLRRSLVTRAGAGDPTILRSQDRSLPPYLSWEEGWAPASPGPPNPASLWRERLAELSALAPVEGSPAPPARSPRVASARAGRAAGPVVKAAGAERELSTAPAARGLPDLDPAAERGDDTEPEDTRDARRAAAPGPVRRDHPPALRRPPSPAQGESRHPRSRDNRQARVVSRSYWT